MPVIPKPLVCQPKAKPAKLSTEVKLRRALAALVRRIGLIGKVAPTDDRLIKVAMDYVNCNWGLNAPVDGPVTIADDRDDVVSSLLTSITSAPIEALDKDIPF